MESIPRNFDAATLFYGDDVAPIFEVALPVASDSRDTISYSNSWKLLARNG